MSRTSRKRIRFTGTVLAVFLLVIAVAASATIYAYFYAYQTATVRAPDLTLAAGTDTSSCSTVYPCATVTIAGTSDVATVTLSIFKGDTGFTPVPATYYSNLVQIKDSTNAHTISSVKVFSVGTTGTPFGSVTVYYCTTQTDFNPDGTPVSACAGSYTVTSAASGTVFSGSQGIAASATQYIEIVSYAGSSASTGNTITFTVSVSWT